MIVSKNRMSAAKICSQESNIYYNLAERLNGFSDIDSTKWASETTGSSASLSNDINFSDHCLYKDVCDKYEEYKKIVVLDDGFSALNIKKNLNIVLIDRTTNIFKQNVIPAGVLREPLTVLKYADVIVITKSSGHVDTGDTIKITDKSLEKNIKRFNKSCPIFYSCYKPVNLLGAGGGKKSLSLNSISGEQIQILTVCAIGNPGYFYDNLTSCGIKIDRKFEFEDHHEYSEEDINCFKNSLNLNNPYIIITTLKDYVKLKRFGEQEKYKDIIKMVYYLDFELVIDEPFFEFIYDAYKKYIEKINPESLPYIIKN